MAGSDVRSAYLQAVQMVQDLLVDIIWAEKVLKVLLVALHVVIHHLLDVGHVIHSQRLHARTSVRLYIHIPERACHHLCQFNTVEGSE